MSKTITKNDLCNLRLNQQKEYYGSEAKAMFIDGKFNTDNWNGGDGIIRRYFSDYNNGLFNEQTGDEIILKSNDWDFEGDIIVSHKLFQEQSYVIIILKGSLFKNGYTHQIEHIAYFTWYKNRGRTENALYNSKPMTEDEYLFVVNALEQASFSYYLDLR